VIINCPQCSKEYVLHLDQLPQAKPLPNHGYGWIMSCHVCKYRWWHKSKTQPDLPLAQNPSDHFEDLGDLPSPKRIVTPVPARPQSFPDESSYYQSSFDGPQTVVEMEEGRLRPEPEAPKTSLSKVLVTFWLLFLLIAGMAFSAFYVYRGDLSRLWSKPNPIPVQVQNPMVLPEPHDPLVLQNVKYSTQAAADGQSYLNVVGEIVNPNQAAVSLNPLRIVVWGHSQNNQASESASEPPASTVKADWSHPWERQHVLPGERLWFQSGTLLAPNVQIERVDVTLP